MRESLTRLNLTVLNILILLAAATLWFSSVSNYGVDDAWASGFFQNFSTEMFGAFATLILVEIVIGASRRRQDEATLKQLQETITATVTAEIHRVQEAAQTAEAEQRRIAKEAEEEQEKKRLILQMGSPFNEFAVEAARILRLHEWLEDGSLQGKDLSHANLQGARLHRANLKVAILRHANLERATLSYANLEGVDLESANLQGASLANAKLQSAVLSYAQLQGADLREVNLQETRLEGAYLQGAHMRAAILLGAKLGSTNLERADLGAANLQGADLSLASLHGASLYAANLKNADLTHANLQSAELGVASLQGANFVGADLQEASFAYKAGDDVLRARLDETTTLPDESKYDPEIGPEQLERFTNSNHPNFWRSDRFYSPAYRGDDEGSEGEDLD